MKKASTGGSPSRNKLLPVSKRRRGRSDSRMVNVSLSAAPAGATVMRQR
jgi:hypothetical protein